MSLTPAFRQVKTNKSNDQPRPKTALAVLGRDDRLVFPIFTQLKLGVSLIKQYMLVFYPQKML